MSRIGYRFRMARHHWHLAWTYARHRHLWPIVLYHLSEAIKDTVRDRERLSR